ncbi:flagellar hook-basal body complex protein FliE [Salinibacillus kushneri]|uniref:Flagellar hook-basal body complex protein FliE n=1 Tax=Salinibacillus kushneri TaxID=237682 RepID=A0A1I0EA99_9BACI|nr:flagellar hook-basal body complex protein FliE [Salinibacillus kushneri]SET41962.1 flagellar hook-basal body complex protein FliE [Salinibacillus kushneri]
MPTVNQALLNQEASMQNANRTTPFKAQQNFADSLKNAINQVNDAQIESDQKTKALAAGEIDNLHDVMIAAQKSSVMLQTAVEVQSKAVEAYKQVMRMQI